MPRRVVPCHQPRLPQISVPTSPRYLELRGVREVAVPFAAVLADLVPADAVRTRRDFPQLLTAIQAVAFLYQLQRGRTSEGWIVATIEDYARAREIFASSF